MLLLHNPRRAATQNLVQSSRKHVLTPWSRVSTPQLAPKSEHVKPIQVTSRLFGTNRFFSSQRVLSLPIQPPHWALLGTRSRPAKEPPLRAVLCLEPPPGSCVCSPCLECLHWAQALFWAPAPYVWHTKWCVRKTERTDMGTQVSSLLRPGMHKHPHGPRECPSHPEGLANSGSP